MTSEVTSHGEQKGLRSAAGTGSGQPRLRGEVSPVLEVVPRLAGVSVPCFAPAAPWLPLGLDQFLTLVRGRGRPGPGPQRRCWGLQALAAEQGGNPAPLCQRLQR